MCESDPLAEYAQEEEPEVDLMQRAQVKIIIVTLLLLTSLAPSSH